MTARGSGSRSGVSHRPEVPGIIDLLLARPRKDRLPTLLRLYPNDPQLRHEVEALLAVDEDEVRFLEQPLLGASWLRPREQEARSLGPFRLERRLGSGEATEVYLATAEADCDTPVRWVAIKTIRAEKCAIDEYRKRLRNEFRYLQWVCAHGCRNVTRCLSYADDPRPHFVMEYIEGLPIEAHCSRRAACASERLRLFQQVCSAVSATHRAKLLHLDLKLDNVLVDKAGQAILIDFGAAERSAPGGRGIRPQVRFLTPAFASLEQLEHRALDERSDLYSLGVMLYYLLSGSHPYAPIERTNIDRQAALYHCRQGRVRKLSTLIGSREFRSADCESGESRLLERSKPSAVSLRELGDQVEELDRIATQAVAREPTDRFASADELWGAIQGIIDQLG